MDNFTFPTLYYICPIINLYISLCTFLRSSSCLLFCIVTKFSDQIYGGFTSG